MKRSIKKPFLLLVVLSMLILMLPQSVLAADLVSGDFNYTLAAGEVTITRYNGTATNLTIPDTIETYPVKAIGNDAFNSIVKSC